MAITHASIYIAVTNKDDVALCVAEWGADVTGDRDLSDKLVQLWRDGAETLRNVAAQLLAHAKPENLGTFSSHIPEAEGQPVSFYATGNGKKHFMTVNPDGTATAGYETIGPVAHS